MIDKLPESIRENQKNLLEHKYSCVELVETYLQRIRKYNKCLNSFITVTDELAYSQAKDTDKQIKEFGKKIYEQDPLFGTAVAYKDLFLTKGVRTTAASNVLKSYIPTYSATVVKKLEDAGCIMIGKTNHDAWGHGSSGENSNFGPTKNPWNTDYVPGGSSSGSAVAVTADFALVATGTDTGSSVRLPASFCNIVGLKPTYGSVSRYGIIAMASSLDSIGHMARDVEDVEKIYDFTKGVDYSDSTLKNFKQKYVDKKLKIGIPNEYFTEGVDKEVGQNVSEAIKVFEKLGIEACKVILPHTKYAISAYYIIQPAEVSSNLARFDGVRYGNDRKSFADEAKRRIMLGNYVLSAGYYGAYYLKAMKVRSRVIEDYNKVFLKVDAIIAPVSPTPPFRLGERADSPLQMYLSDVLTVPCNLAGIPGLAVPSGFAKNGLPLGFQLLGPKFSEPILFQLGKLYQEETDWHKEKPAL